MCHFSFTHFKSGTTSDNVPKKVSTQVLENRFNITTHGGRELKINYIKTIRMTELKTGLIGYGDP